MISGHRGSTPKTQRINIVQTPQVFKAQNTNFNKNKVKAT